MRSITPITAPVSGSWIGAARARPALHGIAEVLGAEDLDGVVERDRGADRVGARAALAPQRALGEVHVAGGAQAHAAPLPSIVISMPLASRDDDQVAGLVGDRRQALVDQRRGAGERVLLVAVVRLGLVGDDRRLAAARGVDAGRRTSAATSR